MVFVVAGVVTSPALSVAASTTTTTVVDTSSTTTPVTTTTVTTATGHYGVGVVRCRFVDSSRTVPNYAVTPPTVLERRRVLVTEIRYPTLEGAGSVSETSGATPAPSTGGFAMIVFASGYKVVPDAYRAMLDAWVRRGFVVAAPIFPDTNPAAVAEQPRTDTELDVNNQPADLTYITRRIVRDSATVSRECPQVLGLIRPSAMALAGQSDGGDTVGLLAYSTGRDPQGVLFRQLRVGLSFDAAIVMSGAEHGKAKYRAIASSPPMMVIQSAQDRCNAPAGAVQLYRDVHAKDKWFLELKTAHHFPPFSGTDRSAFDAVVNVTSQYLEWKLLGTSTASSVIQAGDARPDVAKIFHDGVGPTIPPVDESAVCGTT